MRKILVLTSALLFILTSFSACAEKPRSRAETTAQIQKTATAKSTDIIIEASYANMAWGYHYSGVLICADGSIYTFNTNKPVTTPYDYPNTLKGKGEVLLKIAHPEEKKVSDKDLKKMLEYISQIDKTKQSKRTNTANDAGANVISVYDYSTDSKILLKETGDWTSKNKSPCAKKLIKLVEKYAR